ncbi:MAG: N-acyl-D-glutamate amidohydrolase [Oceanospirillaceae bacterium]|nr:N-acyl-D-glutamate amidohydrolase [Oceanospirillaceae bacterium]MBT12176.1 N-acyl-D-glutamate amidohydrolase [Oceanospirillaceae bacterium]|tara:strand:+ start:85644 stop:87389 length:1746 start_codon:yes stop_codon:yes gene_type:complete
MNHYSLVINNGLYFDGSPDTPARVRHLAIRDGHIADIRDTPFPPGSAEREINASGCWVTPGFIDSHTHYDAELVVAPALSESVRHGVTTALVGSCSLSMVCSDTEDASDIFTRVETVPREKVLPILQQHKTWHSPQSWLDFVNRQPLGPNLISMLGHSDLRTAVMGLHRATSHSDQPTEEEMQRMEAILDEALKLGFIGLSTMCLKWDKVDGDREWSKSLPSTYARWKEVKRLNKLLRQYGRVHQGAPNAANPLQIFDYISQAIMPLGKPLKTTLISMLDLKGNPTVRPMANLVGRFTRLLGGDFRWQVLPTPFKVYADGIDVVLFEEFGAGEMALDLKSQVERNRLFKDEAYRRSFRKFYKQKLSPRVWQRDFGDAVILGCPDNSLVGYNFAEIAEQRSVHVVDLFLDLMVEYGRDLRWYTVIGNHRQAQLKRMVKQPHTLITFSDAGAHIRNMAFYNLPLRFLKLVKESHDQKQPVMALEKAVWRLCGEQADWFGIDAGYIRQGKRADICIINPTQLQQNLELEHWDEMQGFDGLKRMVNRNPGVVPYVIINGRIAVDNEEVVPELGKEKGLGQFLAAQ